MKKLIVCSVLVALSSSGLLSPSSCSAEPSSEIDWNKRIEWALKTDAPDSAKVDVLIYIAQELYRDLGIAEARVSKFESMYAIEKRPWYEAVWNSSIAKVALFLAGIYLGQHMVIVK
jgi:hypothetical protein